MASYLISTPIGGGSFNITNDNSSWCHLDGNRFLIVFGQQNPNHWYAQVVTYNGPTTPPTTGEARIIWQNMAVRPSYVRALAFDGGNSVLVLYGVGNGANSAIHQQWLTIDPLTDEISEGSVMRVALAVTPGTSASASFKAVKLSETRLRLSYNDSSTSNYLCTPTVEIGGAIEIGSTTNYTGAGFLTAWSPVPNTTDMIEWLSLGSSNLIALRVLDNAGEVVTDISGTLGSGAAPSAQRIAASAGRAFISLSNGVNLQTITSNALNQPIQTGGGTISGGLDIFCALDDNHVLGIRTGPVAQSTAYARVFRILSDGVAEVSAPTSMEGGLPLNMGTLDGIKGWYNTSNRYHEGLHSYDVNTKILWFTTNNQIGYKVLKV